MKSSKLIKKGVYKKLALDLEANVTLKDFNNAFLFLDDLQTIGKIIPYKLFENRPNLQCTESGSVFDTWVDFYTGNIEKDFNKGRKLVRVLKDITASYGDYLPFNLASESVFLTMLRSFLLEDSYIYVNNQTEDLMKTIWAVRDYLTALFSADLLFEQDLSEKLVFNLLVSVNNDSIKTAKGLGVGYYGRRC